MSIETFIISEETEGKRIDRYLANVLADKFSRVKIKELILAGKVLVNREVCKKPKFILYSGQSVQINYEVSEVLKTRAENIPIEVVYEDKDLIVVNKPAGMVVHPASGNVGGTLVNALLHYTKSLSKLGGDIRAGIVHRLDKDTSGVMVVAKNDKAHEILARAFKRHEIKKVYWAVVKGVAEHDEMRSEAPLGRSVYDRRKVIVQKEEGKESRTHFMVLKRFKNASLIEARPETGRTHQIRVHLKHLGYPVLGDTVYGIASPLINRQALHAKSISFVHPMTQKKVSFESDLPKDMKNLLKALA